jgi:hypothetical protein
VDLLDEIETAGVVHKRCVACARQAEELFSAGAPGSEVEAMCALMGRAALSLQSEAPDLPPEDEATGTGGAVPAAAAPRLQPHLQSPVR